MAAPASEPGRYSLSGSDIVRPVPAEADDVFKNVRSKHPRAPRSQSTGNMLGAFQGPSDYSKYGPQDLHSEQSERNNLRDLAKFFRTTAPSTNHAESGSGTEHHRKRSIQSMIKRRRPLKRATQSLQLPPSEKIIEKTASKGYPYTNHELAHPANTGLGTQSHYPVIPDATSHPVPRGPKWPERTTSRGALSPTTSSTHTFSRQHSEADMRKPEPSPQFPDLQRSPNAFATHLSGPSDEDLKNFTEARLVAANFLRTLAEQSASSHDPEQDLAQETFERTTVTEHLGPSLMSFGGSKARSTKGDFPDTPPSSGQLHQFEWPQVIVNSAAASPAASPKASLDTERQHSLSSLHSRLASPKSSSSPKRPLNIAIQNSLAVPDESVLPESPGFPRMLAGMTFPSPPRSSRSASPASTLSLMLPTPPAATSAPTIRPRASSKNALTTAFASASLDKIAMLPSRPESSQSRPSIPLRGSRSTEQTSKLHKKYPEPSSKAVSPTGKDAGLLHSEDGGLPEEPAIEARPQSTLSFITADEEREVPRASSALSDTESHRQSVTSISTTRELHRQSSSTNNTNRQSTRSNETTASSAPSIRDGIMRKSHELSSIQTTEKTPPPDNIEGSLSTSNSVLDCGDLSSSKHLLSSATTGNGSNKPLSIAERRMARNGPSSENRDRNIALSRPGSMPALRNMTSPDSIDSPILGWFSHSSRPTRKMSVHGPSPLAQISEPLANPLPIEDESCMKHSSGAIEPRVGGIIQDPPGEASQSSDAAVIAATPVAKRAESATWGISPVMATYIDPVKSPQALSDSVTSSFSISPLIIVASLEPEQVTALPPRQYGSATQTADAQAPPNLPAKSPRRPKYVSRRLSRQIQLPVKVPAIPSSSSELPATSSVSSPGRSIFMAQSTLSQSKAFKRLSLPIYVTPSSAQPTSWSRTPSSRRREWQPTQQAEQEREDEHRPEPTPKTVPRRRSVIIRERIHQVKMARDQEIADLVARTAVTTPSRSEHDMTDEDGDMEHIEEEQMNTTDELEERINRLEQHGDTWLSVLNPLLTNMTRTLDEMKKDGKVSPLLMGEFIFDIAAEARRSLLVKKGADGRSGKNDPVLFENFDGAHQLASFEAELHSNPDPEMTVRIRKTSKGRSPARNAHLRLPLDKSPPKSVKTEAFEAESPNLHHQTVTVPESLPNDSPQTPQQHEFAAQIAVKKRIQEQEIMMDELMVKWGLSPCPSQESIRPAGVVLRDSRQSSKIHSRNSSVEKAKRMQRFDLPNGLGISGSALQSTPTNKHWRKANSDGNRQRDSRRGSRRWSSAGERMSWKPGDSSFMNVLMQELRDTSRLSFEDRGDVESLI